MHAKNSGDAISPNIMFNAKDFLVFSNRSTGGYNYELLREALIRLNGTLITTTIKTGGEEEFKSFGLIESSNVKKKSSNGRVLQWGIRLSDWLFRAIEGDEVLTLHPEYFRLRSSLERRVYEIARKHCGAKAEWIVSLPLLQKKAGSTAPKRNFKISIKKIVTNRTIPDYDLHLDDRDQVHFTAKANSKISSKPKPLTSAHPQPSQLKPQTEELAQRIAAKAGLDRHAIFHQFAETVGRTKWPKNLDAAFIAYLRKAAENNHDQRGFDLFD